MNLKDIYAFRDTVAQVMRHGAPEEWETGAALFHFLDDDKADLVGLVIPEVMPKAMLREAYKQLGCGDVALLAQYRPQAPAVCQRDLVRLGEYQSGAYFAKPVFPKEGHDVHLVDYIIVDGSGGWISVMDAAGVPVCDECQHRILVDTSLPREQWNEYQWEEYRDKHKKDCSLALREYAEA